MLLKVLCCKASYTACLCAGEKSMEFMTEAGINDITPYAAMSAVSDAIFSTFICLCITCLMTSQVLLCSSFCAFQQVPQRHGVQGVISHTLRDFHFWLV